MTRFVPVVLVAVLLLAFGGIAAACSDDGGSGGTLTLEEYFQRLEQLRMDYDTSMAELQEDLDMTPAQSEEEVIEIAGGMLIEGATVMNEFVDDLDGLNPPDEVAEPHEAAVAAARDVVAVAEELRDLIQGGAAAADIEAFLETEPLEGGGTEVFPAKCQELQQIAAANAIDVDLRCSY